MLTPKGEGLVSLKYVYYAMQVIGYKPQEHARQWIGTYSKGLVRMKQGETGLDEVFNAPLIVYPNPVESNSQLNFTKVLSCKQLLISDLTGSIVFNDQASWTANNYHLPTLNHGIYHVHVVDDTTNYFFRLTVFETKE